VPPQSSPSPLLLGDDDVRARIDAATAVRTVRAAILAGQDGSLHAPPRVRADLGGRHLVFTAGRLGVPGVLGFRAYLTRGDADQQLVAVWGARHGELRALVHGTELGVRRTGAVGAVAVDALAAQGPVTLGVVGAGAQAWAQLWAVRTVREPADVRVASRRPERAEVFAARARDELGVAARAVPRVEDAVRARDVVIVATDSRVPVVESEWIDPGTHVTTLGPKTVSRHELPAGLAARASAIVTDSLAQAAGYAEPHALPVERMVDLGAVLTGTAPGRTAPDEITLFSPVGLAGTEVALASVLWEAAVAEKGAAQAPLGHGTDADR
jgi:alanine dehydrogenase